MQAKAGKNAQRPCARLHCSGLPQRLLSSLLFFLSKWHLGLPRCVSGNDGLPLIFALRAATNDSATHQILRRLISARMWAAGQVLDRDRRAGPGRATHIVEFGDAAHCRLLVDQDAHHVLLRRLRPEPVSSADWQQLTAGGHVGGTTLLLYKGACSQECPAQGWDSSAFHLITDMGKCLA